MIVTAGVKMAPNTWHVDETTRREEKGWKRSLVHENIAGWISKNGKPSWWDSFNQIISLNRR